MVFIEVVFLLAVVSVSAVINFALARVDSRRNQYHPVHRPLLVSSLLSVVVFALVFASVLLLVPSSSTSGPQVLAFPVAGIVVGLMFTFAITLLTGLFAYSIGHDGPKQIHLDGTIDNDETSKIRVEETGNPYQPPTT